MMDNIESTPAAVWRNIGEQDPHGSRYDCERAKLAMGRFTDDELANGAFMNYDQPLNIEGIVAGTHHSPIAWMTGVKDRIRWLSRSLFKSEQTNKQLLEALESIIGSTAMHENYDVKIYITKDQLNNARAAIAAAKGE